MSRRPVRARGRSCHHRATTAARWGTQRRGLLGMLILGLCALLSAGALGAQPKKAGPPAASAAASAPATPPSARPAADEPADEAPAALPPGHPDISSLKAPGAGPAGGMPRPRGNSVMGDQSLPPGSIDVVVLDADDRPVAGAPLELHVLRRSMDPGGEPSTQSLPVKASALGSYRFDGLPTGQSVSYQLSTKRGAATFSAEPFGLTSDHGLRVRLHSYDSTSRLDEAQVELAVMVVLEIGESSLSVDHLVRVTNLGPKAWVPSGLELALPAGYAAFDTPETMSDVGAHELPDGKVGFTGTFPPGPTDFNYSYQVPLGGTTEQTMEISLPPGTTWTRLVAGASGGMDLRATGFPAAKPGRSPDGKRILVAERRGPATMAPSSVQLTLSGLPSPGPARWVALGIAFVAAAFAGAAVARSRGAGAAAAERDDLEEARATLLDQIAELEQARRSGRVADADYQAIRRSLLDALGRLAKRLAPAERAAA
jgi:hypothetical protein